MGILLPTPPIAAPCGRIKVTRKALTRGKDISISFFLRVPRPLPGPTASTPRGQCNTHAAARRLPPQLQTRRKQSIYLVLAETCWSPPHRRSRHTATETPPEVRAGGYRPHPLRGQDPPPASERPLLGEDPYKRGPKPPASLSLVELGALEEDLQSLKLPFIQPYPAAARAGVDEDLRGVAILFTGHLTRA